MPPRKQPLTLWDAALNSAGKEVMELCHLVETRFAASPDMLQLPTMLNLHVHLYNKIGPMLENVYERLMGKDGISGPHVRLTNGRILFSAIMHKRMKVFAYCTNDSLFDQCSVQCDSVFWNNQLAKLESIVDLNLNGLLCTNEMLRTIATNCRYLEKLSVCSSSASESGTFDDVGLMELTKCQQLLDVEDSGSFDSIDTSCMQLFLRSLPNLQVVNHKHMGELLAGMDPDDVARLELRFMEDVDVEPEAVALMDRLKHLCRVSLCYCTHSFKRPSQTLLLLAKSSVAISSLTLTDFPFDKGMEALLVEKGEYITSLNLTVNQLDYEDVKVIGKTCINVESIKVLTFYTFPFDDGFLNNDDVMFEKLTSLSLAGNIMWELGIVQIYITHARRIESIKLTNFLLHQESILFEPLDKNPLTELKTLCLHGQRTIPVTKETLTRIFNQCSKLSNMCLDCVITNDARLYLNELRSEIIHKNLDLKLTVFER